MDRVEVDFDHNGPDFAADPVGAVTALRAQCPIAYSTRHGGYWVPTRYADIAAAARNPSAYSSARHPADSGVMGVAIPQTWPIDPLLPIELDPPEHTELRRMLNKVLSRTLVESELVPLIERHTHAFIDSVIEQGECDLILDLAGPIPTYVTLDWLGLPTDQWREIADAQHGMVAFPQGSPEFASAMANQSLVAATITATIVARRAEPRDDIVSYLLAQRVDGAPLSDDTISGLLALLIMGGIDTTTALIGQALVYLADHPDDAQRLGEEPSLWGTATEEFLRYFSPSTGHARTVMCPVEMAGQKLDAGDVVFLSWTAANNDPEQFPEPERMILDRSPNRHAAFGLSAHRCAGAPFAQAEFRVVVAALLDRMPDYRIDHETAHKYPSQGLTSGWSILPATFTPGRRRG